MENEFVKYIQENPNEFQLNFHSVKPKPKGTLDSEIKAINIPDYQTSQVLVAPFHKKISRIHK